MSTTDMAGDLMTGGLCSPLGQLRRGCNVRICRSAKPSPETTVAGQESAGSPPTVGILHCSKTASRFCPSPSASRDQDRDFTAIDVLLRGRRRDSRRWRNLKLCQSRFLPFQARCSCQHGAGWFRRQRYNSDSGTSTWTAVAVKFSGVWLEKKKKEVTGGKIGS